MVNARGGDERKEIRGGARNCVNDWTRGVVVRARNRLAHLKNDNLTVDPTRRSAVVTIDGCFLFLKMV